MSQVAELVGFEGGVARFGDLEQVERDFHRLGRVDPDNPHVYFILGALAHRDGRHEAAIDALAKAIALEPDNADYHGVLGAACQALGRLDAAADAYREAIRLQPDEAGAYDGLGNVLVLQGRHEEAVGALRRLLSIRPGDQAALARAPRPTYAEALNNMGYALANRGKADAAIVCYQQAARLKADYFEAHHNLGNALSGQGRHDEAIAAYREALRLRPDEPRVLKGLAITLSRRERYDEAIGAFRQALAIRPDFPDAWNDLGITLARQARHREAIDAYREAIKSRPSFAEAYNNLGNALRNVGRFDESVECYRKALELKPQYADAHNNFGIALSEMGRFDEAVASYTRCLELRPNHVDAHMNRALTWLRKGDYAQGWAEYEWRWKKRSLSNRPLIQPQWNGFPLEGRTILVVTEQGFGDVLQFVRYAPLLKAQGARPLRMSGEADQAARRLPRDRRADPAGGPAAPLRRLRPAPDRAGAGRHVAGTDPQPGAIPQPGSRAGREVERRAVGLSRVQGGNQLAGQPQVCRRLPPLDPAEVLRGAGAGAWGAALQHPEERWRRAVGAGRREVRGDRAGEPA
ncbi:MAG TPA: tetratricopeptide repeat protein [Opitutaceae bacterium]|nr:tetratricopeptide repeat protein [Opitutaceae bacterium]